MLIMLKGICFGNCLGGALELSLWCWRQVQEGPTQQNICMSAPVAGEELVTRMISLECGPEPYRDRPKKHGQNRAIQVWPGIPRQVPSL